MFLLFQTLGILLDCHDFSEVRESCLHLPSGLWDASCQVPWTCLCSGSSDGLESSLLLQWSPCLYIRGLRYVENSVGRENLKKKCCWVHQTSPCLLSSDALSHLSEGFSFCCLPFPSHIPVRVFTHFLLALNVLVWNYALYPKFMTSDMVTLKCLMLPFTGCLSCPKILTCKLKVIFSFIDYTFFCNTNNKDVKQRRTENQASTGSR